MPRYAQANMPDYEKFYREAVGLDENGASVNDPRDISTAAHMFGCWETLHIIKRSMEACNYRGPQDRQALIEATEAVTEIEAGREHPQGRKVFDGRIHQVFGEQNISQVKEGRLEVVHRTSIEDGRYEPEGDYTKMSF